MFRNYRFTQLVRRVLTNEFGLKPEGQQHAELLAHCSQIRARGQNEYDAAVLFVVGLLDQAGSETADAAELVTVEQIDARRHIAVIARLIDRDKISRDVIETGLAYALQQLRTIHGARAGLS